MADTLQGIIIIGDQVLRVTDIYNLETNTKMQHHADFDGNIIAIAFNHESIKARVQCVRVEDELSRAIIISKFKEIINPTTTGDPGHAKK